jgi:hypothetical protein
MGIIWVTAQLVASEAGLSYLSECECVINEHI